MKIQAIIHTPTMSIEYRLGTLCKRQGKLYWRCVAGLKYNGSLNDFSVLARAKITNDYAEPETWFFDFEESDLEN